MMWNLWSGRSVEDTKVTLVSIPGWREDAQRPQQYVVQPKLRVISEW